MYNFVFRIMLLPVLSYYNISGYTITGIFRAKEWSKTHCSSGGVQHGVIQMWTDKNLLRLDSITLPSLLALSALYFALHAPFTPSASWRRWLPKCWNNSGVDSVYVYVWEWGRGGRDEWFISTSYTLGLLQIALGYTGYKMQRMTLGSILWLR